MGIDHTFVFVLNETRKLCAYTNTSSIEAINGVNYRIADFDYWMGVGPINVTNPDFASCEYPVTSHHLVIVPDERFETVKMYDGSSTSSGYANCIPRSHYNLLFKDFDESNILHKLEILTSSSGTAWAVSILDILSLDMLYGGIYAPNGDAQNKCAYGQLSLYSLDSSFIYNHAGIFWLRDIYSSSHFYVIDGRAKYISAYPANTELGLQPIFGLKAA